MEFALSEDQRMFRNMFRDFAAKEIAPRAEEIDHEETLPQDILRKAANQGFLGATLPEKYFGAELDGVSYAMLIEALAGACVSVALTVATHVSLVAMSILEHGTDAQKDEWLEAMAAGEVIGAFALTEPEAGSDGQAIATRATPDGDDVLLNGVKVWVGNGEIAGLFLVFAKGPEGIDAYLVPRDAPGLTVGYREPTLGLRSMFFNTVYLEDCQVPSANRLGGAGEGWTVAQKALDRFAIAVAAAGLGVAADAVDVAAQFATERVQFGVPIAKKQAIQNYIAEAHIEVEALRYLVYRTAWLADQGRDFSAEASVVKAFGARVARNVTNRMVQVMGGYGFMEDYPMARKYRDARMLGLVGGPTELHYVRVAQHIFAERDLEITP
ncbi:MAG TPA: acyl-CoA dehydrogenase [Thermoflexia bacterium]|jgi:alkylation response protein AidB-like acyl-CoA dehydrogenase|nr:acyl-CoA dehydrogenase [Thermoflexia bacterium]